MSIMRHMENMFESAPIMLNDGRPVPEDVYIEICTAVEDAILDAYGLRNVKLKPIKHDEPITGCYYVDSKREDVPEDAGTEEAGTGRALLLQPKPM